MSGIGNTVETDLVGELVQIWQRGDEQAPQPVLIASGRIRAVSCGNANGYIHAFVELLTADDVQATDLYLRRKLHVVGDIICVTITNGSDWGQYSTYIRLIKS